MLPLHQRQIAENVDIIDRHILDKLVKALIKYVEVPIVQLISIFKHGLIIILVQVIPQQLNRAADLMVILHGY
jgi:hypothetical protein